MTNEEIRAAMMLRYPVIYNGIQYRYISAVIQRMGIREPYMQVELMDKNKHSVTIASPHRVSLAEGGAMYNTAGAGTER